MHRAFAETGHRPWPLPRGPWAWRQSWHDLAFVHWPIPADQLRPLIPTGLELDVRDGVAWIGVVPFHMRGVTRRPLPAVPGMSAFPELNLRTYVRLGGKPGVWFFSLDAANRFAVWTARRWFSLPYVWARMHVTADGEWIRFHSIRLEDPVGLRFEARYRPVGPVFRSERGSLEHWLTERYCLYSVTRDRRVRRAEIHHRPWALQRAEVDIDANELLEPWGLTVEGLPGHVLFARAIDVVVWPLRPTRESGRFPTDSGWTLC